MNILSPENLLTFLQFAVMYTSLSEKYITVSVNYINYNKLPHLECNDVTF